MIPEEEKQIVRRFMNEMNCPKGFSCLSGGPKDLCKARDIGSDIYVECLDALPQACSFAMPFGKTNFCKCPIRIYLARRPGSPVARRRAERGDPGDFELVN